MLRITTFLLLLAVAALTVLAAPATGNAYSRRQATRSSVVRNLQNSPHRRQNPSALPVSPAGFRIRVPTNSAAQSRAGNYFTGLTAGTTPRATTSVASDSDTYALTTDGQLYPLDNASAYLGLVGGSSVELYDVRGPPPMTQTFICSIGAGSVLSCTIPSAPADSRVIGIDTGGSSAMIYTSTAVPIVAVSP